MSAASENVTAAAHENRDGDWSLPARLGFRFIFCYFLLFALTCANVTVWEAVPFVGGRLENAAAAPVNRVAMWVAQRVLHLNGPAAVLHASGFNDRALDWIACGVMLLFALLVTVVWSVVDRRRREYRTAYTWMRYVLRLAIVASMFVYAAMKLSPVQINAPSLGVLNENVGSLSRMTLLWTLLGLSPTYEMICGVLEMTAAVMLLLRRTALAGALVALVIMANVVLFDVFFDIPVKLYAGNLLLMILIVIGPDMRALWRFFFRQTQAALRSAWTPQFPRPWMRRTAWVVEGLIVLTLGINRPIARHRQWVQEEFMTAHPSAWVGIWQVEAASVAEPMVTMSGAVLTQIFFEPDGRITLRASDGSMWGGVLYRGDDPQVTLRLPPGPERHLLVGAFDGQRMELRAADGAVAMRLVRVPAPAHYFLYEQPYRLANEYGEEY